MGIGGFQISEVCGFEIWVTARKNSTLRHFNFFAVARVHTHDVHACTRVCTRARAYAQPRFGLSHN